MNKSHNPENIMVIYAQTDEECQFQPFQDGSYLNYYWLMDKKKRKEVHPLIKKGIAERVEFKQDEKVDDQQFRASLNDLEELEHDLPNASIEVSSVKTTSSKVKSKGESKCVANATMRLGPSRKNQLIDLETTYCKVEKNLIGVPKGCESLELKGKNIKTGEEVAVSFEKE